jgi:ABC-type phosphate transport system permease subunit
MPQSIQYGTALVLLSLILGLNLLATIIRSNARRKRQW